MEASAAACAAELEQEYGPPGVFKGARFPRPGNGFGTSTARPDHIGFFAPGGGGTAPKPTATGSGSFSRLSPLLAPLSPAEAPAYGPANGERRKAERAARAAETERLKAETAAKVGRDREKRW